MEDISKEKTGTETIPVDNRKKSERNECSEDIKANSIIVRYPEGISQTVHVRLCTICLKKIDPEHYFSWEFMEFCNILCISKFQGVHFKCTYCSRFINSTLFGKFYLRTQKILKFFCSLPCMDHYKLTHNNCSFCQRDIPGNFSSSLNLVGVGINNISFCSEVCCKVFNDVIKPPKIPQSSTCGVCKEDRQIMCVLKHDEMLKYFCTKRCLTAYSFVQFQTDAEQCIMCQNYFSQTPSTNFAVYYESVVLIFCSTDCQNVYMLLNGKIVSCSWCQNKRCHFGMIRKFSCIVAQNIYICSVYCFKLYECAAVTGAPTSTTNISEIMNRHYTEINKTSISNINKNVNNMQRPLFVENKQLFVHTKKSLDQRNVATMCFIPKANKDVTVQPDISYKLTQTDGTNEVIVPIPIPLYVPTPMAMYSVPIPTPVPFFLPIPVPIFVPVSRQSFVNIENEIQTMYDTIPSNPCEAELLKIADVIADDEINESQNDHKKNKHALQEDALIRPDLNLKRALEVNKYPCKLEDNVKKHKPFRNLSDNKISLNYSLGVEALRHWVRNKACLSHELVKSVKTKNIFKMDFLEMSSDDLNIILDSFIRNLRKPDGSKYAPDTIYYLCLGIQYYLFGNGRTDNIFLDKSYNKFIHTINKFAEKFYSFHPQESHFIVTRVEEEHLWETRQLGCWSPQVLLNTLVFFNTKYYHCSTVEQHLEISFFQVLKMWKKRAKSKSIVLRFHPKKSKGVCEQYPNESDPTRCPVKIYEFYQSKCPESVKISDRLFYLQPEQYCTSDSPLWYMSSSLSQDALDIMINRLKMVKEINVALYKEIQE